MLASVLRDISKSETSQPLRALTGVPTVWEPSQDKPHYIRGLCLPRKEAD